MSATSRLQFCRKQSGLANTKSIFLQQEAQSDVEVCRNATCAAALAVHIGADAIAANGSLSAQQSSGQRYGEPVVGARSCGTTLW